MSVLIKGMEMPESCYECAYSIERVGICSITQGGCEWGHNRPPHCPLVELPTPHGRLIDADQLYKALTNPVTNERYTPTWGDIANAPTILEAEE